MTPRPQHRKARTLKGRHARYARIAVVISTNMARLGRIRPFEETRFVRVSHDDAVAILARQEALIADPAIIA